MAGNMMDLTGPNKRKYTRIYFPGEQKIAGIIALPYRRGEDQQVKILNLSEGGLFFIKNKENTDHITVGDTIILKSIHGPGPLNVSQEIDMEIKWVSDDPLLENIGYGVEFIDLPTPAAQLFREVIANFSIEGIAE